MPTSVFSSFECNFKNHNGSANPGVQLLRPLGCTETKNISLAWEGNSNSLNITAGTPRSIQGATATSLDNSGLDFAHKHGFGDGESFLDANGINTNGSECQLLHNNASFSGASYRVNRKRAPFHHLQVELNDSPVLSKRQCLGAHSMEQTDDDVTMEAEPMVVQPVSSVPLSMNASPCSVSTPPQPPLCMFNLVPTRRTLGEDEICAPPRDMLDADQHNRAVASERLYHFKCLSSQLGSHLI